MSLISELKASRLSADADEEANLLLLNLVYGHSTVLAVVQAVGNVPDVLATPTRFRVAAKHTDIQEETFMEVISKLKEFCPSYIAKEMPSSRNTYILTPPTGVCLNGCTTRHGSPTPLELHHKACTVTYVLPDAAPVQKEKLSLRCTKCGMNYHYSTYGNKKNGYRFYDQPRDAIAATDQLIVDRSVFNLQWAFR